MIKSVSILGSTGSIGRQALEVCQRLGIRVKALSCGVNSKLLLEQIKQFKPQFVSLADEASAKLLAEALRSEGEAPFPELGYGEEGTCASAALKVDMVLAAISGFACLRPVLSALEHGNPLALANKESLVAAGPLVMNLARKNNLQIIPVDSEHSAIWQCLSGSLPKNLERLWLTASGGPFRDWSAAAMAEATVEQAVRHPLWSMGRKISVDSATMMNKGLEMVEATQLFSVPPGRVSILVHPEGVVHSLVEFKDGELLAQLGNSDMRLAIQLAFSWPERVDGGWPRFDFFADGGRSLSFHKADEERFPALRLAYHAVELGGLNPLVLNAANEIAVQLFLERRLSFGQIAEVCEDALSHFVERSCLTGADLGAIMELDGVVREWSLERAKQRYIR